MKRYCKYIFISCLMLCIVFFPNISYSASEGHDVGSSVYQLFINHMLQNDGAFYSEYVGNKHLCIMDVGSIVNNSELSWYNGSGSDWLNWYNSEANRNHYLENGTYILYAGYFYKNAPVLYDASNYTRDLYNGTILDFEYVLRDPNNGDGAYSDAFKCYKAYYYWSDGTFSTVNLNYGTGSWFLMDYGVPIVWRDDDISIDGLAMSYYASVYTLSPQNISVTGNETGVEMYNKALAWWNANANYYANLWADGTKPSCLIIDNINRDVVANKNGNSIIDHDYIVLLYPDRFTAYIQNNNSIHINPFSLNNSLYYLFLDIGSSNNVSFYRFQNITNTNDFATITNTNIDRILFCNSNIIQRSDANNFYLDSGNFINYYISTMEDAPVYPINPPEEEGSNSQQSSVWTSEDIVGITGKLDQQNETGTGILNAIRGLFAFSTDSVENTIRGMLNTLLSLTPIQFIRDFLSDLVTAYNSALLKSQNMSFSYNIRLFGSNFTFAPFDFFLNNKQFVFPFINILLFCSLIYYIYRECIIIFNATHKGGE